MNLTADQALQVYRGWDEDEGWVYGELGKSDNLTCIFEPTMFYRVPYASVGIFTGQFDTDDKPLFGSLPKTHGGDIVTDITESPMEVVFYEGKFRLKRNVFMVLLHPGVKIIGTQYEKDKS